MAYSALTFTASEVPTLTKWNQLWANDASFNNGTGIGAGAINNTHIAAAALYKSKITNPYKFSAYRNAALSHAGGGFIKVNLDGKLFDTSSNFDAITTFRFVAPVTGFYHFDAAASTGVGSQLWIVSLYKNGSEWSRGAKPQGAGSGAGSNVSDLVQLTAGDYIEVYVYSSAAANYEVGPSGAHPYLSGFLEAVA